MKLIGLTTILAIGCGGGAKKADPPKADMKPTGGDTAHSGDTSHADGGGAAKKEVPAPPPPPDIGGYKLVPPAKLAYAPLDPSNPGGLQVAVVHGDLKSGGAFFLKIPVGKAPVHTHTADYHAVVVSGVAKHWIAGAEAKAKPLAAGSHWFQPGGQAHGDECTGKDPCVVFLIMNGGFDFTPAPKAKPEKPGKYKETARKDAKFVPVDPKQPNGMKMAFVFGDPKTGPVGFLIEVPPKGDSGMHSHTSDYHALVLEGSPAHWLPHEKDAEGLAAGSYWFQPGGYDHGDRCTSDTPCRAFVYMDKALDMKPAAKK